MERNQAKGGGIWCRGTKREEGVEQGGYEVRQRGGIDGGIRLGKRRGQERRWIGW
jgi:hypothetical protein